MLISFQGLRILLECKQGCGTRDEAHRSIGEGTVGTRSTIWKGLGRKTSPCTKSFSGDGPDSSVHRMIFCPGWTRFQMGKNGP
jgi:hypothetical protein